MDNKRLKRIWYGMINRCHGKNLSKKIARYYRDKGITVCNAWRSNFAEFEKWAIENGYNDGLTIDRINPDENYCPENCQWITKSENSRKASSDWEKKTIGEHKSGGGYFMVIESVQKWCCGHCFVMYKVLQTGLSRNEAYSIARKLNSKLPRWEHRYMARVTLNCKEGQLVQLEDTGQYLNSKKQGGKK